MSKTCVFSPFDPIADGVPPPFNPFADGVLPPFDPIVDGASDRGPRTVSHFTTLPNSAALRQAWWRWLSAW
jgi:hypothetical protein